MNAVTSAVDNGIMTITINRPDKMNALNGEVIATIGEMVAEANRRSDVYGMILTGAGDKAFAAGADIAEFAGYDQTQGEEMSRKGHRVFNSIEQSPKPVIAVIHGFALGGGCELAMACHIRLAATTAKFGQPEVNLGIIPGYGGTQRLAQLVGKARALQWTMTGEMIDAEMALNSGLVTGVYESDELLPAAQKMLLKILSKGPAAIGRVIACINAAYEEGRNGYEVEIHGFGQSFGTAEFQEGTSAFLEKRKANFRQKQS